MPGRLLEEGKAGRTCAIYTCDGRSPSEFAIPIGRDAMVAGLRLAFAVRLGFSTFVFVNLTALYR